MTAALDRFWTRPTAHFEPHTIVPRSKLDFQLDETLPRYWMGNDPIKTRIMDAVLYTFPEGEKYFISSVRLFKDKIQHDDKLRQAVQDFTRQEGQHGLVHLIFNALLQQQGLPIDQLVARQKSVMGYYLKHWTPEFNLAYTAGCEHLTAMMAECFFAQQHTLAEADPRVRAMLAWHAIEEMEHKAVAFDVMQAVNVPYRTRALAMLSVSTIFLLLSLHAANILLKHDGQSKRQRLKLVTQGLPWLFGKKGILRPMSRKWLDYFDPNFHPWQHPSLEQYQVWLDTYAETQDAIKAGEALWQHAKP